MESTVIAVLVMLLSAAMYALSYVLQHKGAQTSLGTAGTGKKGVGELIKNPIWVIGVVLFITSFFLHMVALSFGSVSVVQPLIVTELIFIPPFAALISKAKISGRDWLAIFAVAAALAVFLVVCKPSAGDREPSAVTWAITIVIFYVICFGLMGIGRGQRENLRAMMFGIGTGFVNALMALTAKGAFEGNGFLDLLTEPMTWVTVVVAASTIWLTAITFKAGPITASSPAMIATNPLVSAAGAMILFGEMINTSVVSIVTLIVAIAVIAWGVKALEGSEAVHAALDD